MGKNLSVKWYGTSNQEAMLAASSLAELLALAGKYVQGFPEFGSRSTAALPTAYNRVSESPIRVHSEVERPDIEVVMHPNLLKIIDFKTGAREETIYIMNTKLDAETIKERLNLNKNKVYTIDTGGYAFPHILLMTIVVKTMAVIPMKDYKKRLEELLVQKLDANSEQVAEMIRSLDQALAGVKET